MKKLFIISGGTGKEHEVSISSGNNIIETLKNDGVGCSSIIVTKEKRWVYEGKEMSEEEGLDLLKRNDALVFQCIHGTYGEDGELVSRLEEYEIPYIGSDSKVMRLTIDKYATEELLNVNDVRVPQTVLFDRNDSPKYVLPFSFPVIVKPRDEGSSVSLYKVENEEVLHEVIQKELSIRQQILVQEFVKGREFTCGVVEINGELTALVPTEIILTKGKTFDYEAKYTVGGCEEVTSAQIDEGVTKTIQELAKRVHDVCGCKDISRTDFIMKETGELVVLEINTIPGMTKTSFIPAQLKASGYSLIEFVKGMIEKYL